MSGSARPLPLALYGAATSLLEPLAPTLLRRRAARGKEDLARLPERLGRAACARPEGPLVWLHAVSVGESLSLLPLIAGLRARRPKLGILVTSVTMTSAEVLARRLPADVVHQFAPVDGPGAAARFLDHWRPDLAVFTESELWPNLILAARARGVPLALASARMRQDSAAGWARAPASARVLLEAFSVVLPQDAGSAARLAALGGKIGPQLNLKLVGAPLPADAAELDRLRAAVGERKAVLAVSTHPGEERLVAEAWRTAGAGLLIIAPRHPERGPAIAAELIACGFSPVRRAAGEALGSADPIYIADTLGELGLFLRVADVVVMGGGFVDGIGGHNPLEPARLGRPIITGPHTFNARAIYDEMLAEAAVLEAADGQALARHIAGLLAYPAIARRLGEAALDYAERQGAALEAALDVLEPMLPA